MSAYFQSGQKAAVKRLQGQGLLWAMTWYLLGHLILSFQAFPCFPFKPQIHPFPSPPDKPLRAGKAELISLFITSLGTQLLPHVGQPEPKCGHSSPHHLPLACLHLPPYLGFWQAPTHKVLNKCQNNYSSVHHQEQK